MAQPKASATIGGIDDVSIILQLSSQGVAELVRAGRLRATLPPPRMGYCPRLADARFNMRDVHTLVHDDSWNTEPVRFTHPAKLNESEYERACALGAILDALNR